MRPSTTTTGTPALLSVEAMERTPQLFVKSCRSCRCKEKSCLRSSYASRAVTKVERRAIYSIDDGESWRQGAAGLGAGYRLMGTRRRLALSDVVVALTAEGSGKISALIAPEDGTAEEGGDGFYSVRMRCTLRVC